MSGTSVECFTCTKTGQCSQTSVQKIVSGFYCPLYEPVAEPVVYARGRVMSQYGLVAAARALLMRPTEPDEESFTMHYDRPPAGTTYSQRKQKFESGAFIDVRNLGAMVYKNADHTPLLDAGETLQMDRKAETIERVLQFELANGIIVPDAASQQSPPTGVAPMAQQPQMPQMPQQAWSPPGVPQAQQPAPQQMPFQMPAPQQQPAFAAQPGPQQAVVDLTPVLQQVDAVGKAVNAIGAADQEALKQLTTLLSEIRTLLYVQVAATHHIYMGQAHLAQSLAGTDVGDVQKFLGYMQRFIPR